MPDVAIGPFRMGELLVICLTVTLVFAGSVLPSLGDALGRLLTGRRDDATAAPEDKSPPSA